MTRRRVLALAAAVLVLALAGIVVGLATRSGGGTATQTSAIPTTTAGKRSYAQLVAANYKTLTPARTARLLRFADAAYRCMSKQIDLGKPQAQRTKIVLALPPGTSTQAVLRTTARCSARIGDPPSDSSFQVRPGAIVLYLPKYCILDKKVEKTGSS